MQKTAFQNFAGGGVPIEEMFLISDVFVKIGRFREKPSEMGYGNEVFGMKNISSMVQC